MQKRTYSILTIGWSVAILFLTLSSSIGEGGFWLLEIPGMDKVAHFGLFFILAVMASSFTIKNKTSMVWAIVYVIIIAIISEYGQSYVESRTSDVLDFLADIVGMIAGGFVAKRYLKYM